MAPVLVSVAVVVGVVAMAAAGVFGARGAGSSHSHGQPVHYANASAVLRSAASAPGLRNGYRPLGPHGYWYQRVQTTLRGPAGKNRLATYTASSWTAADGSGRQLVSPTRTASGRQVWPSSRERLRPTARPFPFGVGTLSYRQLVTLPNSPPRLVATLEAIAARQVRHATICGIPKDVSACHAYAVFAMIRDAFEAPTPPSLRAALYKLASRLPGVALDGRVRDAGGRPGIAIATVIHSIAWRYRIIVDPTTGRLLEFDRYLTRRIRDQRPGLYWRTLFLTSAVVPSDHAASR